MSFIFTTYMYVIIITSLFVICYYIIISYTSLVLATIVPLLQPHPRAQKESSNRIQDSEIPCCRCLMMVRTLSWMCLGDLPSIGNAPRKSAASLGDIFCWLSMEVLK